MTKIIAIVVMLVMLGSTLVVSANLDTNYDDEMGSITSNNSNIVEIRVAILTDEVENEEFHSQHGRTRYFIYALRDYSWEVDDITYQFIPTLLSTKRLLKGELTLDNYDVLLPPPDPLFEKMFSTGFSRLPKNKLKIRKIQDFIKSGGGYYGSCAAASFAGDMINEPKTFYEKMWKNSCFGISSIKHVYHMAMPMFSQWLGYGIEATGVAGYIEYSGWNTSNYSTNYYNNACLDVNINKNNSIFDDYLEDTRKIRWGSGTKFIIPDDCSDRVTILASYPAEEISDNKSTRVHYWEYADGIRGLTKALIKAILWKSEVHWFDDLGVFFSGFVLAEDWECTDKVIKTYHANSPFLMSEIYPNENDARLVLCAGHPEMNVWWGGHIKEVEDNDHNNIFDGFHHWVDIIPEDKTPEDEFSYNYWIIRRGVAWASQKIPDNDLPPVYGPSQICDLEDEIDSLNFIVNGCSETADGIVSLDLQYRYSDDNSTWNDWTYYQTDNDSSDGWNWEFNSPNGTGYYQFYSIRKVDFGDYEEKEKAPPGPDATARVIE